jgi:hypothetical protein
MIYNVAHKLASSFRFECILECLLRESVLEKQRRHAKHLNFLPEWISKCLDR